MKEGLDFTCLSDSQWTQLQEDLHVLPYNEPQSDTLVVEE